MKMRPKYIVIITALATLLFFSWSFYFHNKSNVIFSETKRIPASTNSDQINLDQSAPEKTSSTSSSVNPAAENIESSPRDKIQEDSIHEPTSTQEQKNIKIAEQQKPTQIQNPPQPVVMSQTQKMGLSLFFGLGINYFQYKEDLFDANTRYNGLKSPSTHFGMNIKTSDLTDLEVFYKITPLFFDNGSVGLAKTEDSWKTLGIQEARKSEHYSRTKNTDENPQSEDRDFRWLYGIQIHEMPLALFANNNSTPTLRTIDLVNLSIGTKSTSYINPWTRTIVFARLQYPISSSPTSGGSFTLLNPDLLFDGSLGIEKRIISNFWLGLHWYGTYHQIDFKYSDTIINAQGTQSALFSTLEARLLFDF